MKTLKRFASRLKVLPGLMVFIAAFGVGSLAAFYYRLPDGPNVVVTASGLKYVDLVEGHGATPRSGQRIIVHYKGSIENGRDVENTYQLGNPTSFQVGRGSLIQGWEEGLMTMKVGGKRRLIIPPELGYGSAGSPRKIPPNATLIFEVELLEIMADSRSEASLPFHFD